MSSRVNVSVLVFALFMPTLAEAQAPPTYEDIPFEPVAIEPAPLPPRPAPELDSEPAQSLDPVVEPMNPGNPKLVRQGRIVLFTGLGLLALIPVGAAVAGWSHAKDQPHADVGFGILGASVASGPLITTGAVMISIGKPPQRLQPPLDPKTSRRIKLGRRLALGSIPFFLLVPLGGAFILSASLYEGGGIDITGSTAQTEPPPGPPDFEIGVAMCAIGALGAITLLTTGATMIGVAKHRETKRLRAGIPVPMISPRGAAVGWTLRF
jgi:hypothetical protein